MAPESPAVRWYAVWTRSRAEKAVHDQLGAKGVEVFLPTVTRWSRWKDRRKKVDWPLFPGYCFARFDARDSLRVMTCNGVASVVSFDGKLAPVPDVEVESVRRLVTSGLQYDPCPFREGGLARRGGARPAEGGRRPAGEEGPEREAGAVGRPHKLGGFGDGGRG